MPRSLDLENVKIDRKAFLNLARLFATDEGTCLLYSGGNFETARHSFLGLFPFDFIWVKGQKQLRFHQDGEKRIELSLKNPWDALKSMMNFNGQGQFPEWMGFFGYEMGAYSDFQKSFELMSSKTPDIYFQRCAIVLAVDHQTETGTVWIADQAEYFLNEHQRHWFERLSLKSQWESLFSGVTAFRHTVDVPPSLILSSPIESEKSYIEKIEAAKKLILEGEIYQVNLSQSIELKGSADPFQLFYRLNLLNPAPFSAYFRLRDFTIISTSPERFLKKKGDVIESRPIKGTIPRGKTPDEDLQNQSSLINSEKERAELLMITDLMRNDLGKISQPGSVETVNIFECEAYTNVFHLSSTVRARALPEFHSVDIVRSCFPGGSITGCPKLSAMEVIAKLENRPRGIYTGAIGYFAANGDFDFNIAIRTLVISGDSIQIQLGGAIVADSNPLKEYEETFHKGFSLFKALNFGLSIFS